jgi:hypothetical protein
MRFGIRDLMTTTLIACAYCAMAGAGLFETSRSLPSHSRLLANAPFLIAFEIALVSLALYAGNRYACSRAGRRVCRLILFGTGRYIAALHVAIVLMIAVLALLTPLIEGADPEFAPIHLIVVACMMHAPFLLPNGGHFFHENGVVAAGGYLPFSRHSFSVTETVDGFDLQQPGLRFGRLLVPTEHVEEVRAILAAKQEKEGTTDHTDGHR